MNKNIMNTINTKKIKSYLAKNIRCEPSTMRKLKANRGFTLVEMLVSIGVFTVVMTVASGSLLSIIDANNKAQSLKSAVNNLNFAIESMAKNIRVGSKYTSCSSDNSCIGFTSNTDSDGDTNNDFITYKYDNKSIERCVNLTGSPTCNNFIRMTAGGVTINNLKFYIVTGDEVSNKPGRVLIIISGEAGTKEKIKTKFNLQTTVSQRSF